MTPQHDSLSAFLAMGGYGFFVWWSYAIVAVTLVLNVLLPLWRNRQTARQLRQNFRRAELAGSQPVQDSGRQGRGRVGAEAPET